MRFATFTAGIRKALEGFSASATERITDTGDSFDAAISHSGYTDYYLTHAWVNIAIGILMRNIGRTEFVIKRNGERIQSGLVFSLFDQPSSSLNRFDLWKETGAWWFLEGEAFWYFGEDYSAGIPNEIIILNPRKMSMRIEHGQVTRWFYANDGELIPILPDEIVHFRDWNPWNP